MGAGTRQTFNAAGAQVQASMLLLAAVALVMPTIFQLVHGGALPGVGEERVDFGSDLERMSFVVAIILLVSYVAGLFFSLRTHEQLFNPHGEEDPRATRGRSVARSSRSRSRASPSA